MTLRAALPPTPNSYQVDINPTEFQAGGGSLLWGGEYPGHSDPDKARERLQRLLDAGITHFINLTEADERPDHYEALLESLAKDQNSAVLHQRSPIRDFNTPTPQQLNQILDEIDTSLAQGHNVYVHCWGGIGRTGTVIGCWLVRHGLSGTEALANIANWRKDTLSGHMESPETLEQRNLVLNWGKTR